MITAITILVESILIENQSEMRELETETDAVLGL